VSTSKVLVSDFIDGMSLEAYLNSNPSQKSKDEYAQLIFDSFFYSLYHLGRIHADPNPANFLFMDDGKLAMIDFGCIKKIDEHFLKGYNALHLALIEDVSDEEIMEHYIKFGMITKDTHENMLDFYREIIRPLDRFYIEPLSCESMISGFITIFPNEVLRRFLKFTKSSITRFTNSMKSIFF